MEESPRLINRSDCGNAGDATSASFLEQAMVRQPNHCSLELVIEVHETSLDPRNRRLREGECNMTIAKGLVPLVKTDPLKGIIIIL